MENNRFDTIARGLTTGASRRRLLGGLFGATAVALGGTALSGGVTEAKKKSKVEICHKGKKITVSERSLQAHLNHGDCTGSCPCPL